MTTPDDDNRLMLRIALQDTKAYRVLVAKYLPYCVRFAERMTGSRPDAEEIAQDVCFRIWQEAGKWKQDKAQFSTWLYRVLYNRCIDYKRKVIPFAEANIEDRADTTPDAEQDLMARQRAEQVRAALKTLPARQRAAVILSYYEGVQGREAAEIMDVHYDYFYHLLSQARNAMRQALVEEGREMKNER